VVLTRVFALGGRIVDTVVDTARGAVAEVVDIARAAAPGYPTWLVEDRAHLAVRGVHRPEAQAAAEHVERLLAERDGVRSAELNAVLGHVVIHHDPDRLGSRELNRLVSEVERDCGLDREPHAPAGRNHPGAAVSLVQEALLAGLQVTGLVYATLGRALPALPVGYLAPAPTLVSLVDAVPWLRAVAEAGIGKPATDTLLGAATAASNASARRSLGLLVDACLRVSLYGETAARRRAWAQWDRVLADRAGAHRAAALYCSPRPVPVPDGPVERLANSSAALAVGGYAAALAGSRDRRRADAVLLSAVPKAARVGREGFAAQLGRDLAGRGSLVLDREVLRHLDRVDTVLIDAPVLLTGRRVVEDVLPVADGIDPVELYERAYDLVDLRRPRRKRQRGGWSVRPFAEAGVEVTVEPAESVQQAAVEGADKGATVLLLQRDARPVALVFVVAKLDPLADALVAAANSAGRVLIAGCNGALQRRLPVDGSVPGGDQLLASVRALQDGGSVVGLVSARSGSSLAAADVGIGIAGTGGRLPWGAAVLCGEVAQACVLLQAVAPARSASRRSAQLSIAGSGLASLLAVLGPAAGAPDRAAIPVHMAALVALGAGTWWAMSAGRRPAPVPRESTPWHTMSPRSVLQSLSSSHTGLSEAEAEHRQREQPAAHEPQPVGLGQASLEELANPLTPALAAGAGISASTGSALDAVMISTVLGLNALIGGAQRLSADRALRQLGRTSAPPVRVRRQGGEVGEATVRADQLVTGDLVELHAGDAVPADCRILSARGVEVDESSLTGESTVVAKSAAATVATDLAERHCMLYEGTVVAAGDAVAVVVATGQRTEAGRAARLHEQDAPLTGVEVRLRTLTARVLPVSVGAGVALTAVDLLRGRPVAQALNRAVSLAVAAVPEGLPFVATVAELAAARRLSARGALVRNTSTIEALGRVDVLCFDKTGTLTEGRITLRCVSDGAQTCSVHDVSPQLRRIVGVAVRASPWRTGEQQVPHQTDRAILRGARRLGVTADEGQDWIEQLDELRFESGRGYHASLWRSSHGHRLSIKGAPEVVLPLSTRWRQGKTVVPLDDAARHRIDEEIDRLARQGYRVLAVAERSTSPKPDLRESRIRKLEFCGLLALSDPVRPTAADAVGTLQAAGVSIMMITGDHPSTAESIAAELNALNGRQVLTGAHLDAMDDEQLAAALPSTAVFARVTPAQKARIVRGLQQAGRTVAVTGDGTNDAPAIRMADVGLALGTRATPAARQAADVVITDDRIETITDAIVEGRGMWSSVRDALSILLGGNLGEIAYALGTGLLTGGEVLNARQLLLVNLLTDVLPAMAVAVRPPPNVSPTQLLAEGPEASLGHALTLDVSLRAVTTAVAATAAWLIARPVSTPGQAGTTGLVALVAAQLGQTIAVRGRTPLVLAAAIGSLLLLAAAVQLPGVSRVVGCRPLLPHQWAIALVAATAATVAQLIGQALAGSRPAPEIGSDEMSSPRHPTAKRRPSTGH
jgi:cation-transporting ATPase I